MNYIISGKNIDVTEGLKNAVYDKLSKLEKYFAEDAVAQVTFSVEKRQTEDRSYDPYERTYHSCRTGK